ncbi:MAG: hypothetical protein HYT76_01760 [Deltaproteobacteria bacterium]|nr:hypothetical protein [Deltaproteobacteria bacterium]
MPPPLSRYAEYLRSLTSAPSYPQPLEQLQPARTIALTPAQDLLDTIFSRTPRILEERGPERVLTQPIHHLQSYLHNVSQQAEWLRIQAVNMPRGKSHGLSWLMRRKAIAQARVIQRSADAASRRVEAIKSGWTPKSLERTRDLVARTIMLVDNLKGEADEILRIAPTATFPARHELSQPFARAFFAFLNRVYNFYIERGATHQIASRYGLPMTAMIMLVSVTAVFNG